MCYDGVVMVQMVFNSEGDYYRRPGAGKFVRGGLVNWLIKISGGLISTERAANRALLLFALVVFAAAFMVLFRSL